MTLMLITPVFIAILIIIITTAKKTFESGKMKQGTHDITKSPWDAGHPVVGFSLGDIEPEVWGRYRGRGRGASRELQKKVSCPDANL